MTKNEMVEWHHRLSGHGFGQTLAIGDRQGGLVCCGSWGHKESDTTEQLNRMSVLVQSPPDEHPCVNLIYKYTA